MKTSVRNLGVFAFLGLATSANAGVFWLETSLGPQYTATIDATDDAGLSSSSTVPSTHGIGITTRNTMGFTALPWLLVGGTLNYGTITVNRAVSTDATVPVDGEKRTNTKLEFGPTLGFFIGAFKLEGTYILGGNQVVTNNITPADGSPSTSIKETSKISSGFQISGSYLFNLSSKFKIGPTLVFRNVWYKSKDLVDNVNAANNKSFTYMTKAVDGTFEPMVTLAVSF